MCLKKKSDKMLEARFNAYPINQYWNQITDFKIAIVEDIIDTGIIGIGNSESAVDTGNECIFKANVGFELSAMLISVLVQTGLALFRRFYPGYPAYKVGVAAHAGGMVAGGYSLFHFDHFVSFF